MFNGSIGTSESQLLCIAASASNRRRCFRLCNNPRPSSLVRPQARFCRPGGVHTPTPSEGRQKRRQRGAGCGPVKARCWRSRSRKTGSRGVPGRTPCCPHGAARYSALYRPDNRTRKCPALLIGAGHFSWAGKPPPLGCRITATPPLRRVPHGRAVCEKAIVHRTPTILTKGVLCDALRDYALRETQRRTGLRH